MHEEYVKVFYSFFLEYTNEGFYGDVKTIRMKLQEKTGRYIPNKYVMYSINVFCEAGVLHIYDYKLSYNRIELSEIVTIKSHVKYRWSVSKFNIMDDDRKLELLSLSFTNYFLETSILTTEKEINIFNCLYTEKYEMGLTILGDDTEEFFIKRQLRECVTNIHNVNRIRLEQQYRKLEKLSNEDFIRYKENKHFENQIQKQRSDDYLKLQIVKQNNKIELQRKYDTIFLSICKVIEEMISEYGYVSVVLCYYEKSILYVEMMIKYIEYQSERQVFLMLNEFSNIELKPYNLKLKEKNIIFLNQSAEEQLRVVLKDISSEKALNLDILLYKYEEVRTNLFLFGYY